ncbi:hypothetical protein BKCO1_7600014 [Neofusicoccum parvum]|nr:hypothetical protein BKCO1_7600014 [Neofusicoccum parvum]
MSGFNSIRDWLQLGSIIAAIMSPASALAPTTTQFKRVHVRAADRTTIPSTTAAPSLQHAAIQPRDSSTAIFNTCGFINSDANSALYCGGAYSCVFFSSTANTPGMAGCCADTSYQTCNWYSTCYDSAQLSTACTAAACQSDPLALRCTETASPRCARWTWPALDVVDFACTYAEDDAGSTVTATTNWTTMAISAVDTFFSDPTSYAVNVTWAPASALSAKRADASSSSSESAASGSAAASASTVASAAASSSAAGASGGGGGGTPTGVIVGGVVGAVVGLIGLVAAAVMFCCLMRRRKRDAAAPEQRQQPDGANLPPSDVHELQQPVGFGYRPPAEVEGQGYRPPAEVEGQGYNAYQGNHYKGYAELGDGGGVQRPVMEMDGRTRIAEMGA